MSCFALASALRCCDDEKYLPSYRQKNVRNVRNAGGNGFSNDFVTDALPGSDTIE
jgi:hypothetical protein